MEEFRFKQIGIIHSPFKEPKGTPIQSTSATGIEGTVELYEAFTAGLKDLNGFSHLILVYVFHLVRETSLEVIPYMDNEPHGVFSTRAPGRPNAIGISTVRLTSIHGSVLHVRDMVDGTPLLDIKPYVPAFDQRDEIRIGWLQKNISKLQGSADDGRFIY